MSMSADPVLLDAWHTGALMEGDLASALMCDAHDIRVLLDVLDGEAGRGASPLPFSLPPRARVGAAISYALHDRAGLSLASAADVVAKSMKICDSILATLDFFPSAKRLFAERDRKRDWRDERDPLVLFAPHASEELPVPAIDEYIDVIDGRRIVWRKPRRDAYELACELDRLSDATTRQNTPELQQELLAILGRLREPADHTAEWIGIVDDRGFRPRPDRFADFTPFLRRGVELSGDASRFTEACRTRISVNVSLAARSMKRRLLGLPVNDPLELSAPRQRSEEPMPCT